MLVVMWFFIYVTGIIYYVTATSNFGIRDPELSSDSRSERIAIIFLFLFGASWSLGNMIVGYWAVAIKKEKDYMLHKCCMSFSFVFISGLGYGKTILLATQLYLGPHCLVGARGLGASYTIGYVLQLIVMIVSIYLYDKRIFQLKCVKWNLFGYFLSCCLFCFATAISFSSSSAEEGCIDEIF